VSPRVFSTSLIRFSRCVTGGSLETGISQRNVGDELAGDVPRRFPSPLWREIIQDTSGTICRAAQSLPGLLWLTRVRDGAQRELELFNDLCGLLRIDRHIPLLSDGSAFNTMDHSASHASAVLSSALTSRGFAV
jgi:hypothetical protein